MEQLIESKKYFKDNIELLEDLYDNFIHKNLYNFNFFNKNANDLFEKFIYSALNIDNTILTNDLLLITNLFNDYSDLINIICNIYNSIYTLLLNNDYSFNDITTIQISSNDTSIINKSVINLKIQDITNNFRILLKLFNDNLTSEFTFKQQYAEDYPSIKYSNNFSINNNGILNGISNINYYNMSVNEKIYKIYYSNSDYDNNADNGPIKLFNCNESSSIGARFTNNIYDSTGYYKPSSTRNNYLINNNYKGEWIVIKLPIYVALSGYYIIQNPNAPYNAPSIFRVYGSSDGINWDIIDDNSSPIIYDNNKYIKKFSKETILYNYVCFTFSQIFNNNINGCLEFIQLKLLARELEINQIADLNSYKLTFNKKDLVIDNNNYDITNFNKSKIKFINNNLYNILNSNSYDIMINLNYYNFLYIIIQNQNSIFLLILNSASNDIINKELISLNLKLTPLIKTNNINLNNNITNTENYIKTLDHANRTIKKYSKLKPKSNLNKINYNNNYKLINNVKIISYIIIILLIIISIISIYIILSQKYEFKNKIYYLIILLLITIVTLLILYYYKNNNIIEKFDTNTDINSNLTLYLNNIKQLIFIMNKQILQLSIYDTKDLSNMNTNIKDYNNKINQNKLNNLKKTNLNISNNNNIIFINYLNYINLNILFCYLTILIIFSLILLMIFQDYYHIIISIIIIIIIIIFLNYYNNNHEITRLKSNTKYWNNNFTNNY